MVSMEYDLEIDQVIEKIKKEKAQTVCIQLPEGMRPLAGKIRDELHQKTGATVMIWAGSCYGACDIPLEVQRLGVDLLIQWGHKEWIY